MSKIEKDTGNNKIFLKIIEGSLRQSVPEGTHDAILREWQAGGQTGTVHEIVHKAAYGKIIDVSFYDGEKDGRKFKTLNITLDENEDGKTPVIGVSVCTKYAQDIMKKLPNINFDEEVRIRPFSFIPDGEEKNVVGVEITQRDKEDNFTKKVENHFIEKKTTDGIEKWLPINGFPAREKTYNEQTDEEREIYKIQVRSFLIKNTEKLSQDLAFNKKYDKPKPFQSKEEEDAAYPANDLGDQKF